MGRNTHLWRIGNQQAKVDKFHLQRLFRDLGHGEAAYVGRSALAVDLADRGRDKKRLYFNGFAPALTEAELPRVFDEDPEASLVMAVRLLLPATKRRPLIDGVCVDDSFEEVDEHTHIDDRIPYVSLDDAEWQPMPVLEGGYVSSLLSAEHMRSALKRQFAVELGHNALFDLARHPENLQ